MNDDADRDSLTDSAAIGETPGQIGAIAPAFLAQVIGAIGDGDAPLLRRTFDELHPADAADLLERLPSEAFKKVVHLLGGHIPPESLVELADDIRHDALAELSDEQLASIIGQLDSDDASFLLNDIEEERLTAILDRISAGDRVAIETSLAFDEESAGRLMQRDFVAAPVFWTVGQAIDHMRTVSDLPEEFFEIYLVDPGFRLQGVVPLSRLLKFPRETLLSSLQVEAPVQVRPEMDQEEVAFLFQRYNLASAPVVDDAGRLTGMITIDDMVDVIQEENREDMLALSGVSEASANQSVLSAVKARIPWLGVNLFTAFAAAAVVALFHGVIEQAVALAILMPVIAGLCGNAGSQALAVAVRAIAERQLEGPMVVRAIRREALTAIINGVLIGGGASLITFFWFQDIRIAGVMMLAMFLSFTWSGLVGILAPLTLKKLGADPAVASAVFVLTAIDMAGFFALLGLGSLVLL